MKLKTIRLAGFKTFVDPTTLQLRGPLTGVVGPNGCGKSNVVDAVRWVLGESSARQLRGDALADVIFNGSSARQPVGKASVELVFDNSAGTLGGAWAAYAEIAVRRQLTRDGQSVYFLNGSRCRRRDITDIFLGTGLGPRSYAIIEQGMIARLIEARPEELRSFIEEVAGISKYKERRQESAGRIRHTRDNMARLDDVRDEIAKRLTVLDRQARAAETFRELRAAERQARGQLLGFRLRALQAATEERRRALEASLTAQEQAAAAQRAAEAQVESARAAQAAATGVMGQAQQAWYQVGAEVARLDQALAAAQQQRERTTQELARLDASAAQIDQQCADTDARLRELAAAQQTGEDELRRLDAELAQAVQVLSTAEGRLGEARRAYDAVASAANDAAQRERLEQERARRVAEHLARLGERRGRLDRELAQLAAETRVDAGALTDALAAAQADVQAAEAALAASEADIARLRAQLDAIGADTTRLQTTLREQRGRLAALETLQQAALAGSKPAEDWLARRGIETSALLAALDAEPAWRSALEATLGPWIAARVVPSLDALPADGLAQAAGLLLIESRVSVAGDGDLLRAVHSAVDLAALVGAVRRAGTLADALAARHTLPAHGSFVTADGTRVGRNWIAVPAAGQGGGVLERGADIADLQRALAQGEQQLASLDAARSAARSELTQAEQARGEARQRHSAGLRLLADLQARQAAAQAHHERVEARRQSIATELAELDRQTAADTAELAAAQAARDAARDEQVGFSAQREPRETERRAAEQAVRDARAALEAVRELQQTLRLRVQAARTEIATLEKTLLGWQAQRSGIRERHAALLAERDDSAAPLAAVQAELQTQLAAREQAAAQLASARDALAAAENTLRERDQARLLAERGFQERRADVEARRLEVTELATRFEALLGQAQEFDADAAQLIADAPTDRDEAALEFAIADLARRIERLGPINLAAIDEQRELAERKTYLDAQHADLAAALETMEQAIRRMDRETRSRFKETFDAANAGFMAAFPRLFGGGEARLELLDDDLLETGVGIVARPPGKRNSSIHLLSGGEKALTAIALVFALFELSPAPFCMLDEVDAPLDDHNVGRFCALVREMSARVQFIVITHNKTTMEMAGQLTGVTMSEPGVSRLVAVDVDEAVALATS
jgi:chromosome segregation protein